MHKWNNPHVRDLAWAISSPCVIEHRTTPKAEFFQTEYEKFLPILEQLDKQPDELLEFISKSKRAALGNYFEDLIEFWLERRENTKVLARNLQVIDGKQTIGECDFIVELDGVITHVEVAIKYYLGIQNSSDQKVWVGRGLTDRLDIKYEKLFKQQLELSNHSATSIQLDAHNIAPVEAKMAIVKGFFFKHYFTGNHALPENAPADIENSFWCNIVELEKLPQDLDRWQILTKPHWLTYDDEYFGRKELEQRAQNYFDNVKETPVLCNALSNKKDPKPIKFFIAPSALSSFRP